MKMLLLVAALVVAALAGGCSLLKVNFSKTNQFPESECPGYSFNRIDEFNECITSAVRLKVLSGSHTESADACRSIPEVYGVRLSSGSDVGDVYSLDDCLKDPVVMQNIQRKAAAWRYQQQREDQEAEERARQDAIEAEAKEEAKRKAALEADAATKEYEARQQKAFALIPPEDSQLLAQRIGSLYRLRAFTMLKNLEDRCWQEKTPSCAERPLSARCWRCPAHWRIKPLVLVYRHWFTNRLRLTVAIWSTLKNC
jgi:hypothetical protein